MITNNGKDLFKDSQKLQHKHEEKKPCRNLHWESGAAYWCNV